MKFKCPKCGEVINRDLRLTISKHFITKKGYYRSYCEQSGKTTYLKPVKG